MSDQKSYKDSLGIGTSATISIRAHKHGFDIGLDLNGERLDMRSPTAVQALALIGVEAVRTATREHFEVHGENVFSREKLCAADGSSH